MNQLDVAKKEIIAELNSLPPETLPEIQAFIEFLHFKTDQGSRPIAAAQPDKWQSALAATFGMWADRDDVEGDGVAYVQRIRRGHRLDDFMSQADEAD